MDEAARARGIGLCEATTREWRRSACDLRDHAARPGLARHVRDALLRESSSCERGDVETETVTAAHGAPGALAPGRATDIARVPLPVRAAGGDHTGS